MANTTTFRNIKKQVIVLVVCGAVGITGKTYYTYAKEEMKRTANEEINKSQLANRVGSIEIKTKVHETMLINQTAVLNKLLDSNKKIEREQIISNNILCRILPEYKDYKSVTASKVHKDTFNLALICDTISDELEQKYKDKIKDLVNSKDVEVLISQINSK